MKVFKLDKTLATNTDYTTESDIALIIQEVGTDDTAKVTAKVEGIPCAEFTSYLGPLNSNPTNRLPLLNLKDLYIVVPPDKIFRFEGTSEKNVRIKGLLLRFEPNEGLPAEYIARYTEQGKIFFSYLIASLENDTAVPAGSAIDLLTFTCPSGQKYVFNSYFMASLQDTTPAINYGLVSRILVNDSPLDNLMNSKILLGIDQHATPLPPNDTDGVSVFSFEDKPIALTEGNILKVQIQNITSDSITANTNSTCLIACKKEYL
jgi:hypothetical protein